jgi:hypothetical protein
MINFSGKNTSRMHKAKKIFLQEKLSFKNQALTGLKNTIQYHLWNKIFLKLTLG